MDRKPRLLIYSDDYRHLTGFSSELRPLLPFFAENYELHYFAVFSNKNDTEPVPTYAAIDSAHSDPFGEETFKKIVATIKPDVILANQDLQIIQRCVLPPCVEFNIPLVNWGIIDCDRLPPVFFNLAINIDHHVYQTYYTKKAFEELHYLRNANFDVIYPPIHKEFFEVKRDYEAMSDYKAKRRVFCVGKNIPRKFIPTLLEATRLLDDYNKEFEVVIHSQELAANVSTDLNTVRRGMKLRNVVFTQELYKADFINENLLAQLYASSDLFVLPSGREGVGIPLLEAMATRTPCVSTGFSAMDELLQEGRGFLISPRAFIYEPGGGHVINAVITPEDLAKQMYEILFNPDNQKKIRDVVEVGYEFAQNLKPELIYQKLNKNIIKAFNSKKNKNNSLQTVHIM